MLIELIASLAILFMMGMLLCFVLNFHTAAIVFGTISVISAGALALSAVWGVL